MKTLEDIGPDDAGSVGGKAFHCARLKRLGIPVPDGLVLTTDATGGPLDLPELREWLSRLKPETLLAVRSSATDEDSAGFSFAGIHETRLNVRPHDVADAVRGCWSSVGSPEALAYRRARQLSTEDPRTAVLIQTMVHPVSAGVAFTLNPITGATDEIVINSVSGLGEKLVSGRAEPDEFRVSRSGEVLASHVVNDPASLDQAQLRELADLLIEIERHSGGPQDVEWCHDGEQFWIVQSRPITTKAAGRARDVQWTRANLREVLPDLPSYMTATAMCEGLNRAHRKFYGRIMASEAALGPMTAMFHGRVYFNVDHIRLTCRLTAVAPAVVLRSIGHQGELSPADEIVGYPSFRELGRVIPSFLSIAGRQLTIRRRLRVEIARMQRVMARLASEDATTLSDAELWASVERSRDEIVEDLQLVILLVSILFTYQAPLQAICRRVGFPYDRLVLTHLAAGEKSVSAQQGFDLVTLAKNARERGGIDDGELAEFIRRYGHRGRYESDWSLPRYEEDPAPLLFAIRAHVEAPECPDPALIQRRQDDEAASAWGDFERRLNLVQRLTLGRLARWLLRRAKQTYLSRELVRSEWVRIAALDRARHLVLAERFASRGWLGARADYFLLTLDEVGAAIANPVKGKELAAIVVRRKAERARWAAIEMPLLMRESELPAVARRPSTRADDPDADTLSGLCVSAGSAEGEVVVMRDPGEFARMKRGAILVAPATDPSWTPLFTLASGVIVEVGGMLSHASTVAREYGLPALANVKNATRILKSGDRVHLDATNGVVTRRP